MKKSIYLLGCATCVLAGCAVVERPVPVPTATVTHEVVATTEPGVTREVIVARTPPAVRVEARTVSPGPRYVWTPGYWRWTGTDYDWFPGRWLIPPRPTAAWVEGRWVRRPGGWVWIAGHWR